ncbi:MAG: hypothetical protein ACTSRP_13320 [Candidatus Helarchaeota archaeon]
MEYLEDKLKKTEFQPAQINLQATFVVQKDKLVKFLFRSMIKLLK